MVIATIVLFFKIVWEIFDFFLQLIFLGIEILIQLIVAILNHFLKKLN